MIVRNNTFAILRRGEMPERYSRNLGTIGVAGQLRLLESRVAIVGAGGLGGHVIELLARQGVGYLRIIDGDTFAVHNLNRQILATEENLGLNKALAAGRRIQQINTDVAYEALPQMLNQENARSYLESMDVVVDALDNLSSRIVLAAAAQEAGIPLVHGAIAGFSGKIAVIPPGDGCWKAALLGCSGSPEQGVEQQWGNPPCTPALAASLQAQEVVKILTGVGRILARRMIYFDMDQSIFEVLDL